GPSAGVRDVGGGVDGADEQAGGQAAPHAHAILGHLLHAGLHDGLGGGGDEGLGDDRGPRVLEVVGDHAVHARNGRGGNGGFASRNTEARLVVVVVNELRERGADIGGLARDEEGRDVDAHLIA